MGSAYLAKTAPDGYTWLVTTASHTNTPPFSKNVPFDPVRDFTHVTLIAQNFGQVLVVPPALPARNVRELIGLAKKQPGKLNYGSAGIGTASHIPAELMKSMSGTDIVGIQYKGVAEVMTDLLSGRIEMFSSARKSPRSRCRPASCGRLRSPVRGAGKDCPTCRPCRSPASRTTT